jgi:hypothetical protein
MVADETLFIDDSAVNVAAAAAAGLRAVRYHSAPQLNAELTRSGLL